MVFFNYATMQMAAKIVYYGPGLCGKTTNLHQIYAKTAPQSRGEMVSLETETDRTLFFDLLPIDVGVIGGFKTRLQLYTVPGQVFYNTTRKLVLKGVDGIVFVADSQAPALESNVESLRNLRDNLTEIGLDMNEIPLVIQLNKRDLPNIVPVETMLNAMDPERHFDHVEAIAASGQGVFETLKLISKLTLRQLRSRMSGEDSAKAAPRGRRPDIAEFRVKNAGEEASPMRTIAATTPIPDLADAVAEQPDATPEAPAAPAAAAEVASHAAVETLIAPEPAVEEQPAAPFEESSPVEDDHALSDLLSTTMSESEMEQEPAFSLDDEAAPTTQYIPPPAAPEPQPAAEAEEPIAAAHAAEVAAEPEVDFSRAEEPAKPAPEVKHVKVRSSIDVMAELESLRKKATQPVTKGKKDPTADLSALLGGKRDLTKNVSLSVASDTLARTKALRVTLSFDDDQGVVHTEDRVIELKDPSDVQTLLVNLKIERA